MVRKQNTFNELDVSSASHPDIEFKFELFEVRAVWFPTQIEVWQCGPNDQNYHLQASSMWVHVWNE